MITLDPWTLLNGNGIDVNSLVTQALSGANAQVQLLQQQQATLGSNAGLLNSINSDLSSLAAAVNSLSDVLGPLASKTASSSQNSILTAAAQLGASPGTHTVVVNTLATRGTLYTDAVTDATTSILPSGAPSATIQFQVGGSAGATHEIAVSSGTNDTLNKLASYVNAQNWAVTASVITDASGARLAIYSNNSGSGGALAITGNSSALIFNPAVGGTNATFTVDGIPFSSSSNTVNGAIPGVALNLVGAYPGIQVQVAVGADNNRSAQAINDFVSAYNTLISDLNRQFTVDPSTNAEGPLAAHSSLRSLQSSLLADASYSPPANTIYSSSAKTAATSILPSGAQTADFHFQVGGSGGAIHDIALSAGTNDTLASLANYINQQGWGVNAAVATDANGSHLNITTGHANAWGALAVINNTTSLSFNTSAANSYGNLNGLGITMNNDGTLSVNTSKLSSAITNDPASVLNFFQNTAQTGFANVFAKDLQGLTSPTLGLLNLDLAENRTTVQDLSNSIQDLLDRIGAEQKQLQAQFSQINALLQAFPYQLQALQLELGVTPSNSRTKG